MADEEKVGPGIPKWANTVLGFQNSQPCVQIRRNGRSWKRVRPEAATQYTSQANAQTAANAMTTTSFVRRQPHGQKQL